MRNQQFPQEKIALFFRLLQARGSRFGFVHLVQNYFLSMEWILFVFHMPTYGKADSGKWQYANSKGVYICIFLAAPHGFWDIVPRPGIEPAPLALKAWSPNHWIPGNSQKEYIFNNLKMIILFIFWGGQGIATLFGKPAD